MDILRLITAGSVDDGKSTLIGRLLYDSKNIMQDQLQAIEKQSKQITVNGLDLALLTDGLRAEREQGITIDVAYRYFSTPNRKFILADAPGHLQYTCNMVTGSSNCSAMIVLIDGRNGVIEQTRRHSIIASLLGIETLIVAINKMDLMNYEEAAYTSIVKNYQEFASTQGIKSISYIPISALNGDNIVSLSKNMPWYKGKHFFELLEVIPAKALQHNLPARFPIQYTILQHESGYRGHAGKVSSGIFKVGDEIIVMPSGIESTIKTVEKNGRLLTQSETGECVVMQLTDNIAVSRGDIIVLKNEKTFITNEVEVFAFWMGSKPLQKGYRYILQINCKRVVCKVSEIEYKLNVNSLAKELVDFVQLNDIVKLSLITSSPIVADAYKLFPQTGNGILIDEITCTTVGAIVITNGENTDNQ